MTRSTAIARSTFVALLALILAAGAVAAGHHDEDQLRGLERAAEASGKTVPANAEPAELPEDAPDGDPEAPTAPTVETAGEHPENHGKYVSEAAQVETPEGCDNHGAYVRIIARSDLGKPGSETTEVPTSCDEPASAEASAAAKVRPAKAAKPVKPAHARGHAHGLNR